VFFTKKQFQNMKSGAVIMLIMSLLVFTDCKQKGCTEILATNFNPDANKEDGSCIFPTDDFVGTWSATDTFRTTNANGTSQTVKSYTFTIRKQSTTDVFLKGFNSCTRDSIRCSVAGNGFRLTANTNNSCDVKELAGSKNEKVMVYSFKPEFSISGTTFLTSGKATKQ
jgi:hypothetical protein